MWGLFVLGKTTLGHGAMDINIQGPGIAAQHCFIENKAGLITLHPCGNQCSMDGLPVTKPVRLSQGKQPHCTFRSFTKVQSFRSSSKSSTVFCSISHIKIQTWFLSVKSLMKGNQCTQTERKSAPPLCLLSEGTIWLNRLGGGVCFG